MHAIIAYRRVSTEKQGRSGLGLEAQEAVIAGYCRATGATVIATYTDIESGKVDDRPQLAAAIEAAKLHRAKLVVPTLDRLSRDVAYIAALMKRGVDFACADMPSASTFELHIRAAIAEEERRKISERTRLALAAAKRRGVKLGGYRGTAPDNDARSKAIEIRQTKAAEYARQIIPHIDRTLTLRDNAARLNGMHLTTPRGCVWTAAAVKRVIDTVAA